MMSTLLQWMICVLLVSYLLKKVYTRRQSKDPLTIRDVVSKVTTRVDSSFELKLSPLSVIFQKNHKLETQTQLDRRIFRQTRNSNFRTWVNSISIYSAVNSDYFSKLGQFLATLHLKLVRLDQFVRTF